MESTDKVSILLVDDRPENLLALEAVLETLGENCVSASSGKEALRQLLLQEFAVILLDARMPGMDGFETAAYIRQRDKSANTPIIFITANDVSADHVFRGYAAGAVDYVIKPFDPDVLRSKVQVFVNLFRKTQEIQRQAREIEEIQLKYKAVLRAAPEGICILDDAWTIVWHNRAFSRLLSPKSASTEGLAGIGFSRYFSDALEEPERERQIKAKIDRIGIAQQETIFLRHDGSRIWCDLSIVGLDPAKKGSGYVATLRDITDRKNAELALRKSEEALRDREERLRSILDTATDAILTADDSGRILSVNAAFERMFGYDDQELIGKHAAALVPPSRVAEYKRLLSDYQAFHKTWADGASREGVAQRKDGSVFPVEIAVSEVPHLRLYTAIIRDISERRNLETQLLRNNDKERERISRDIHDSVNQRLVGLAMLSAALSRRLKGATPEAVSLCAELYEGLQGAVQELRSVIYNLAPLEMSDGNLGGALRRLVAETQARFGLECEAQCGESAIQIGPVEGGHVYRIAQEAINNAVKHSKAGKIVVRLEGDVAGLEVEVSDDGNGGLFGSSRNGQGMGLRIMQYRANVIGASLVVASQPGKGTRISCHLPRQKSAPELDEKTA